MVLEFLSIKEAAKYLGMTVPGIYSSSTFPKEDARIGRTRGWTTATLDEWNNEVRPKKGRPTVEISPEEKERRRLAHNHRNLVNYYKRKKERQAERERQEREQEEK